jgi:DNA polymerase-3 subunit beta
MKFSISKTALLEALQVVQGVVSLRSTLPILSNVLIKADKKHLTLTTTDLDVSMRCNVEATIKSSGATSLPVRRLLSIVRELPEGNVDVEVDDKNAATIKAGAAFFKIMGLSEDEFPPSPTVEGGTAHSMAQASLRDMFRKTSYAVSTDETRRVLNGVHLSFRGDKLTMVATDGRRLALVEHAIDVPEKNEKDMIIPAKAVKELVHVLKDEGDAQLHVLDKQVAVECANVLMVCKLIEGNYPNFRQVVPSQCEERVTVERESLLVALRRVSLLTTDKANSVRLTFAKNKIEISTVTPDVGEAREAIPIKYSGKQISVAFNPEYVMDPLRNMDDDEVFFELVDDLSPGVIKCASPFVYVLMPMRIS